MQCRYASILDMLPTEPVFSSQIAPKWPFLHSTRTACGERRYSVSYLAFYGRDKHHNRKQRGEVRAHFITQFTVDHDQKSQQECKVGAWRQTEAEVMRGCCLSACSPWLAFSIFLYSQGPPAQRYPPYSRLGSPKY